jgi:hypothetical protein
MTVRHGNAVHDCEADQKADTTWVDPRFDAEIAYAEITSDGMVRQPSFKPLLLHGSGRAGRVTS